jgi:5-methylcytosine-specific restriction endonuclease McrA
MPLWKLQTVGEERLDFLYENLGRGSRITLKRGVAYCLRAFYGLLRDLIQGAWVRFVQRLNASRLGSVTDLGTFLFGQERASLDVYRPILLDVQHGTCLYCQKKLSKQSQVDYFVPWSRYPADLGHNFVLAHDQCNNAKSDYLAAEKHLAAWAERNRLHQKELQSRFQAAWLPCDLPGTIQIAKWVSADREGQRAGVGGGKGLATSQPCLAAVLVGMMRFQRCPPSALFLQKQRYPGPDQDQWQKRRCDQGQPSHWTTPLHCREVGATGQDFP